LCFFFFFVLFLPPPSSTLFPYTTLFRSGEMRGATGAWRGAGCDPVGSATPATRSRPSPSPSPTTPTTGRSGACPSTHPARVIRRSEEHTSELQSRENLVCRLLLEKKKK